MFVKNVSFYHNVEFWAFNIITFNFLSFEISKVLLLLFSSSSLFIFICDLWVDSQTLQDALKKARQPDRIKTDLGKSSIVLSKRLRYAGFPIIGIRAVIIPINENVFASSSRSTHWNINCRVLHLNFEALMIIKTPSLNRYL